MRLSGPVAAIAVLASLLAFAAAAAPAEAGLRRAATRAPARPATARLSLPIRVRNRVSGFLARRRAARAAASERRARLAPYKAEALDADDGGLTLRERRDEARGWAEVLTVGSVIFATAVTTFVTWAQMYYGGDGLAQAFAHTAAGSALFSLVPLATSGAAWADASQFDRQATRQAEARLAAEQAR